MEINKDLIIEGKNTSLNSLVDTANTASSTASTALNTGYFNGTTTSINDLNYNGKWRGYIQNGSNDANFLGLNGNFLVETFNQSNANAVVQRITCYGNGRQKWRTCSNNAFSYDDSLFEPYMLRTGDTVSGNYKFSSGWISMEHSTSSNHYLYIGNESYANTNEVQTKNSVIKIGMGTDTSRFRIWNYTKGVAVLSSDANGNNTFNGSASENLLKKNINKGIVNITPSAANTPTSSAVTWSAMDGTPAVICSPNSSAPGTVVLGCGATGASSTGATIWVTRNSTTQTGVYYIAVYK